MYWQILAPTFLALAAAQGPPPPPVLLTVSKSGVIPIPPTPFPGVETEEGAIIYDGPPVPGFTGPGGNASVQSHLPKATYIATLPSTNFDDLTGSTITGSIMAMTNADGTGVTFSVNFTGFPSEAEYGQFVYHIHGLPVPADGNCTATLGHLDPTNRGEYHPCEVAAPQTCQAGDLAGKHGNITASPFVATYSDNYLSTDPSSQYFFGDKSVVIHSRNTTRLTCANFKMASNSTGGGSGSSNGTVTMTAGPTGTGSSGSTGTGSATSSEPSVIQSNVANALGNSAVVAGGALGALVALFL